MVAREVAEIFRTTYDRYGSEEGITDYEMSRVINEATLLTMKYHFQPQRFQHPKGINGQPMMGFENTKYESEDFQPLICDDIEVTSNSDGVITDSQLSTAFPADKVYLEDGSVISDNKTDIFHYLNVCRWSGSVYEECRYVRHHEKKRQADNAFLGPVDDCPTYSFIKEGVKMRPGGSRNAQVTFVRYPVHFWYLPEQGIEVDPELPGSIMMDIIFRAVQLAGMGVRDNEVYQFAESERSQI